MKKWHERDDTGNVGLDSVSKRRRWTGFALPKLLPWKNNRRKLPQHLSFAKPSMLLRVEVVFSFAKDALVRTFERERAAGTLFHFAPLIFGVGISIYFVVPAEPLLWVLLGTFAIFALAAIRLLNHGAGWIFVCAVALFFGGMSAANIRTNMVGNHSLVFPVTGQVSGTIIEVTQNRRGAPRYLIAPIKIEHVNQNKLPTYIRMSAASKHIAAIPGDKISGLGRLQPVSGPAYPGSFDFSFNAWYDGLGGTGFFMGKPQITKSTAESENTPTTMRFFIVVNSLRTKIAGRIKAALPGQSGDVAVALIIGDRTGIDGKIQESLRASGLAHVLAISGMHMALVSLTMVWAVRFALAFNMRLANTMPIKNWAALAGFVTASAYLTISGMGVATQRAWIMISVMMLAAMVSRKSITLRGVAIAALVILAVQPESILSPGFQMSFAAVTAIVAAYEWLDERRGKNGNYRRYNRIFRFFGTLIFTSLIAGLATALFAAYHFHRIAPLGVLTNLLAMPIVSTLVMPMALLSVLAMPYGLEQLALIPMGAGIDQVVTMANFVNTLGGNGVTGQLGAAVLPLAFIAIFLLTMLKTILRLSGVGVLLAILFIYPPDRVPDILLSEDGRAIGIKSQNDKLAMLYPRRNKFVRDIWLRAFSGDEQGKVQNSGECNKDICGALTRQGALVIVVYDPDLLPFACARADILLAPKLRWVNCRQRKPALIIKRGQLEEFGAHAIYLDGNHADDESSKSKRSFQITKVSTAITNSNRPWNIHRQGRAEYRQD